MGKWIHFTAEHRLKYRLYVRLSEEFKHKLGKKFQENWEKFPHMSISKCCREVSFVYFWVQVLVIDRETCQESHCAIKWKSFFQLTTLLPLMPCPLYKSPAKLVERLKYPCEDDKPNSFVMSNEAKRPSGPIWLNVSKYQRKAGWLLCPGMIWFAFR